MELLPFQATPAGQKPAGPVFAERHKLNHAYRIVCQGVRTHLSRMWLLVAAAEVDRASRDTRYCRDWRDGSCQGTRIRPAWRIWPGRLAVKHRLTCRTHGGLPDLREMRRRQFHSASGPSQLGLAPSASVGRMATIYQGRRRRAGICIPVGVTPAGTDSGECDANRNPTLAADRPQHLNSAGHRLCMHCSASVSSMTGQALTRAEQCIRNRESMPAPRDAPYRRRSQPY
jgi:hypothetical protein